MGYAPLVYQYGKDVEAGFPPDRVIYHYAESKLPIILGIPTASAGHALVVVGHSFEPDSWFPFAEMPYYQFPHSGGPYHCSTTWVQNFLVQDDNFGQYLVIPKELLFWLSQYSLFVIVPLPNNINVKGEDAEIYAHHLISDLNTLNFMDKIIPKVTKTTKMWMKVFLDHLKEREIILRTYLIKSRDYKAKVIKSFSNKDLIKIYQKMKMPEYVWVTEISVPTIFCHERKMLGEVIVDPTASKRLRSIFSFNSSAGAVGGAQKGPNTAAVAQGQHESGRKGPSINFLKTS